MLWAPAGSSYDASHQAPPGTRPRAGSKAPRSTARGPLATPRPRTPPSRSRSPMRASPTSSSPRETSRSGWSAPRRPPSGATTLASAPSSCLPIAQRRTVQFGSTVKPIRGTPGPTTFDEDPWISVTDHVPAIAAGINITDRIPTGTIDLGADYAVTSLELSYVAHPAPNKYRESGRIVSLCAVRIRSSSRAGRVDILRPVQLWRAHGARRPRTVWARALHQSSEFIRA
eukprot:scaffold120013_cov78-Phaeocystis_antarctica.AAC.1